MSRTLDVQDITVNGLLLAVREDSMVYRHSYVDDDGRLHKGKWLKVNPKYIGLPKLIISNKDTGILVQVKIDELVCRAFHGQCPKHYSGKVKHLDGYDYNNVFTNLAWCKD